MTSAFNFPDISSIGSCLLSYRPINDLVVDIDHEKLSVLLCIRMPAIYASLTSRFPEIDLYTKIMRLSLLGVLYVFEMKNCKFRYKPQYTIILNIPRTVIQRPNTTQ